MSLKQIKLVFLAAIALLLIRCAAPEPVAPQPITQELYRLSKNSVEVKVVLERNQAGQTQLTAVFTPDEPALHLYAKEFPRTGIDGVGRPTLLEILSGPAQPASQLQANVPSESRDINGFDEPFLLYPDGPVIITLPVLLPETIPESTELELSITYMACSSDGGCKPPVTDNRFAVILPDTLWHN